MYYLVNVRDYESGSYNQCCKFDGPQCQGISGYYEPSYGEYYGSKYSTGYGLHTKCIGGYRYPYY